MVQLSVIEIGCWNWQEEREKELHAAQALAAEGAGVVQVRRNCVGSFCLSEIKISLQMI
jgi:hypothetical protein